MGHCMFLRKGETHTAPVTYAANFADNTWEQIIDACQKNAVPDTWLVADQKTMTINGTDYLIDIIGKNHDVYSDGSGTAPLTFQLHDCYNTTYAMNSARTNSGGWTNCVMRTTHLPTILALMPNEVQSGIKHVDKLSEAGGSSKEIVTTSDNLFLLSSREVWGSDAQVTLIDGEQYSYYAAGNSKLKKSSGSYVHWWQRTTAYGAQTNRFTGTTSSETVGSMYADVSYGVSFAFCF